MPTRSTRSITSPGWMSAFLLKQIPGSESSTSGQMKQKSLFRGKRLFLFWGEKTLFVLVHGYTGIARLLFSLGLFDSHSLVYPFIGSFEIGGPGCRIVALQIR